MKKKPPLTRRQLLATCCILLTALLLLALIMGRKQDQRQFDRLTSRLFQEEMTANTLNMHYTIAHPDQFGIHSYEACLPTYTPGRQAELQQTLEEWLTALEALDAENLTEQDRYTYTLLTRSLNNSKALNQYYLYEEPLSPSSGMQSQLPILLAEYTFRTKQDVEDYLSLLSQVDTYFASLLQLEQEKYNAGLIMSGSSMEKAIEQCDTIVTKEQLDSGNHFLQTGFTQRLTRLADEDNADRIDLTKEEIDSYLQQNNDLLYQTVLPAYQALADGLLLLKDSSVPLRGLAALPQGRDYYREMLISQTGSYRSPEEIKALLTEQINKEYDAIKALVKEHPDLATCLNDYDPSGFPYAGPAEMLTDLQKRLSEDFPKLTVGQQSPPRVTIKKVSDNLEEYCAPAFYLTAPLDDSDNNVIYINQKNSPAGLELYTTLAHEGYPGHLYQTVYSNRFFTANDVNCARQLLWYGGYLEGWALYVEFLSYDYACALWKEQNEPERAVITQLEKHNRSLQLCLYSILDIMIHYENASYEQVAGMLSSFGITKPASQKAVYTYIVEEPCNYLKYYLGYCEFLLLQDDARKLWGDSYTDYRFHEFILESGPSDFTSLSERLQLSCLSPERTGSHSGVRVPG